MLLSETRRLVAPPDEKPFWVVFVQSEEGQAVPVVSGGIVDLAVNELGGEIVEMERIREAEEE